jgi:hypothetical protein
MLEATGFQEVTREEVGRKPVENEKHRRPSRQVTKTANLSICRFKGLERWPSELP